MKTHPDKTTNGPQRMLRTNTGQLPFIVRKENFGGIFFEPKIDRPFVTTETTGKFDVKASVKGGGKYAQVDALVHGISKALQEMDPEMRLPLKKAGLLTRDPRAKERKKYGQRGARARFQFSKR